MSEAGMAHDAAGKKAKAGKPKKMKKNRDLPKVMEPRVDAPSVKTPYGSIDIDDPELPDWVEERALKSGGYPYDETIGDELYEEDLTRLQIELVKLQQHVARKGARLVVVFEGHDAAGKGGSIFVFRQYMNPRAARIVALPKPTESERGQWYFQRYAQELPTSGEIVLFDRSWYNRAGVERVMGFCSEAECRIFLQQAPEFEKLLVDQGIVLFKFWLNIGRAMQLKRFHERRHNPLKIWKLSPMDYAGLKKWDDYQTARDEMLAATHNAATPWMVVKANDKRRARLNIIRHVLGAIDYPGKDAHVVHATDPLIVGTGPDLLGRE
jgi:polyphosphate kinase 2